MTLGRPDPDELLKRVSREERAASRGKLTIFFGAAPGVGKTCTMLEAARTEIEQGRDVVVGVVETHGRYDTAALVMGFPILALKTISHQGIVLSELDLDAVLARKPGLVLIDELAHTNAPGCRHVKRFQDVEEIIDAGIDVLTTLNVQHLASLNDVVAQITGVVVRETVPDAVFDGATEVRLVDLPVDELLDRLRGGKVYVAEQAALARENFFREGNLIALREIALRRTAERVDAQMRDYKAAHGIGKTWHAGERIVVCVSPSPHSDALVRAAARAAQSLHASFIGVYVETPASIRMTPADRKRLTANLRTVEALGGEVVTLSGESAAVETVRFARTRNVTRIVLGKPTHARWHDTFRPSFLDDIVRESGDIDVHVIAAWSDDKKGHEPPALDAIPTSRVRDYAAVALTIAAATTVGWLVFGRDEAGDVAMTFQLAIILVALRFGSRASLVAAVVSILSFDFFFIPPYFSFAMSDLRHGLTFGVMFLVAAVVGRLSDRLRGQGDAARARELRTASLLALSRELSAARSKRAMLASTVRHVRDVFGAGVTVLLPGKAGHLEPAIDGAETVVLDEKELGVAEWVWIHQRPAGVSTDTLPAGRIMFVPLRGSRGPVGILAVAPTDLSRFLDPDARHLLSAFSGLIGSAIERSLLASEARAAQVAIETERLRNALLSSVSHDLRTPLGVVTGATSALLDESGPKDEAARRELVQTAHDEAMRLSHLVHNLLEMTRLEAGALRVEREAHPIDSVIGAALERMGGRLTGREVSVSVPDDLPPVSIDAALIEQVLINLLENAAKYSPPGTPLHIGAVARDGTVEVAVEDRGEGVPKELAARIFDKFFRVHEKEGGGVGLGLTICRGVVTAHGGRIWVEARDGGGSSFRFTLPCSEREGATATATAGELSVPSLRPAAAS